MNLLTEHEVAHVGGGLTLSWSPPTRRLVVFPEPLPGMPYPGPVLQFE